MRPAIVSNRSIANVVISLFFIAWVTCANGKLDPGSVIFLLILPWLLVRAGRIVTAALRFPSFFSFDFLAGAVAVSVVVLTWKLLVPVSLWALFGLLLALLLFLPGILQESPAASTSWLELLAVIISLVATTAWSQDLLRPIQVTDHSFIFKPWSDFLFHATIVARSLGSKTLLQTGLYEWKGLPAIVYHYASYSLPICLARTSNLSCYIVVVSFWAPFGCFISGLSAYALGRAFWSEGAGLAALAAIMVIPDAALLNFGHPFYGYHWLQEVDPGGFYGVSIAGLALAFVAQGRFVQKRSWIVAGVTTGILVAFFKVHIFAASFPLVFAFAVLSWPGATAFTRRVFLVAVIVLSGIAVQCASYLHIGPGVHFDFSGNGWFWGALSDMARGTPVSNWYRVFEGGKAFPAHLLRAIVLLILSTLGLFVILMPITLVWAIKSHRWEPVHGLMLASILVLLVMTFILSPNSVLGLPEELLHRPFVWAYWLAAALSCGFLYSLGRGRISHMGRAGATAALLVLMAIPIWYGHGLQRGRWPGAVAHASLKIDRGLVECAYYIRDHDQAHALVQDSNLESPFPILPALSGHPSYAARPKFWARISRAFRSSNYQQNLADLRQLQSADTETTLRKWARATGIRWYLAHPSDNVVWPMPFRDHPVFGSNGYRLYDLNECFKEHS